MVEGGAIPRPCPVYRQRLAGDDGVFGLISSIESEEAIVRIEDGVTYLCPSRTRVRMLHAMLELGDSPVGDMADVLVPDNEARKLSRELSRLRKRNPFAVPFLQQSGWHVPIRWFLLVRDTERTLAEEPDGSYRLVYRTTLSKARRRLDWSIAVVARTDLEPLAEMLRDLSRWLANFDRHSILELDYASLSRLFTWDELDNDRSARDINEAIDALGGGEVSRSADLYQAVAGKWAEVRSHESMN